MNAEEIEKNQLNTTETNEVIVSEEKKDAPKKIKKMGKLKLSQVKKASKLKKLKKIKLKRNPKKES